jgi:mevalonate kinase
VEPHTGYGQTVAKIILFGEHAVVYGHPAIALPLTSLRMTAHVTPTGGGAQESTLSGLGWTGRLQDAPSRFASIARAAEVASAFAGHPDAGLHISTRSDFPPERGLGSSAAAAGAVIRAVLDAYDVPATREEIFDLTQQAETVAHGRPSGLDAVATSSDTAVHFQGGQPTDLAYALDAWIIIADSGEEGSTLETVTHVRSRYNADPTATGVVLDRLGAITGEVVDDMRAGDIVDMGDRMTEAHHLLAGLGVSDERLDAMVAAAVDAGALGAKLTGGGRGGCVIALAGDETEAHRVEEALVLAGAASTWVHAPQPGSFAGEGAR